MERHFKLNLERFYAAPPERVFRAWTALEEVARWLSCGAGLATTVKRWDARPGGTLRVELTPDGGGEAVVLEGRFLEVTPPRTLAYEWGPSVVRVELRPVPGGTRVHVDNRGRGPEGIDDQVSGGWRDAFGRLDRCLSDTSANQEEAP